MKTGPKGKVSNKEQRRSCAAPVDLISFPQKLLPLLLKHRTPRTIKLVGLATQSRTRFNFVMPRNENETHKTFTRRLTLWLNIWSVLIGSWLLATHPLHPSAGSMTTKKHLQSILVIAKQSNKIHHLFLSISGRRSSDSNDPVMSIEMPWVSLSAFFFFYICCTWMDSWIHNP